MGVASGVDAGFILWLFPGVESVVAPAVLANPSVDLLQEFCIVFPECLATIHVIDFVSLRRMSNRVHAEASQRTLVHATLPPCHL